MRKLSRNDPCWCGSGRKYKNCHWKQDQAARRERRSVLGKMQRSSRIIIKTEEQIDGIRRSGQLTRDILDMLEDRIQPGITSNDIDRWVYEYTIAHGAIPAPLNYRGFPKSVCTSINQVVCHGIPDDTILREGDILNVDVTSILNGYYGDASRMFTIGEVSDQARQLAQVTRECLYLGIEQVKPGNTLGDIGHAIQQHAESHGYSIVREYIGHGTGLQFHEPPDVRHFGEPHTGLTLQPNMVFTIEPMINAGKCQVRVLDDAWTVVTVDGCLSAQWEHTLRVTDDGVEILTA
ncbi:MAG TPA: methionyl aminopeptidase [Chloroflexi bacterium]|nr:methionyl aminopeptidase [Chloroflexota bacterium]